MLANVTGNVGAHLAVGATASLLCVLLVMGLKLKWFRARMTFDQPAAQQETPYVGVYRSTFTEDFDSPPPPTSSVAPSRPPPPPPPPQPTTSQPTAGRSKEDKTKKTKENKPKVPQEKEVKTKPPKAAKSKAPKLPAEVKPEVIKTTETKPKGTKTKASKVKAPKSPKEVTPNVSKPTDKGKGTKEQKHKSKSKDNGAGNQLPNGVVKGGNNVFSQAEKEVESPTNDAFLFVRPENKKLPQSQPQDEANNALLHYSEEDSFEWGQNRAMKTFSSMMPTKGQVDLSASPIPHYGKANPRVLRNPIAAGVNSYKPPRPQTGFSKESNGSVYINMNGQSMKSDKQIFVNLEDESES